jgi:hypothetical protein
MCDSGVQHSEACFASDMRQLNDGIEIEIPDDTNGGMRTVTIKAWVMLLSADFLGAASLLPFCETTGAHSLCRACDFNKAKKGAHAAFSFLWEEDSCRLGQKTLRDWPVLKARLEKLRANPEKVPCAPPAHPAHSAWLGSGLYVYIA